MKGKHKILFTISLLILTVIIIAGFSYAFYFSKLNKVGSSEASLLSKTLSLNYTDGPEIVISNILPGQKIIKTFTVTNTGSESVYYAIEMKNVTYDFEGFDITYSIASTNSGYTCSDVIYIPGTTYLGSSTILPNVTQEYTLTIEFLNQPFDQLNNYNKSLFFELAITDKQPIYGIKRSLTTSSSTWERTDDSVGKVANATHNGTAVVNDFDNIEPWSLIYSYNYDRDSGLETARIGDSNFKFDGTNGEVLTKIPSFYYRRYQDSDYEYIQISMHPVEGFTKINAFSVGRYDSSFDGTQVHSYSGTEPEVNRNITSFRTLSREVGTNFGQLDWRIFVLQMLYLVEYADYNSQTTLGMASNFRSTSAESEQALVAENNVNRIIIDSSIAALFALGQQISIGTSSAGDFGVARFRTITAKEAYDDGNVTGTAVYFDGDPVNIAVGNALWSSGQKSGVTDVLGMKSGCISNTKSPIIYRGIENIFGNVWQFVDGINIKDFVAYVSYDPITYQSNVFTGAYQPIGYVNATVSSSTYAAKVGYDSNNPLIIFATDVTNGSSSSYLTDYYSSSTGNRIARVGGNLSSGYAGGLFCWYLNSPYTISAYNMGSRLLRY
ncbi:MAG: hypothetical protein J5892_02030 [Bacilli bacterium]|nr:hypothetical protein [Bacilli bacterium]